MDMLQTDRTYKTRDNAVKALKVACSKLAYLDLDIHQIDYVIAVDENGRFAPIVLRSRGNARGEGNNPHMISFAHIGVTVTGS